MLFIPVAVHLSWKLEHPGTVVTLNGILLIMSICEMFSVHGIAFIGTCAIVKWTFISEVGMCFHVVNKTAWIFKVLCTLTAYNRALHMYFKVDFKRFSCKENLTTLFTGES